MDAPGMPAILQICWRVGIRASRRCLSVSFDMRADDCGLVPG